MSAGGSRCFRRTVSTVSGDGFAMSPVAISVTAEETSLTRSLLFIAFLKKF